jgi:predicted dehydrogenase
MITTPTGSGRSALPALTRRNFLRISGATAGAMALGIPTLLKARGANSKLNVAFIGLGGQGRSRLDEILGCGVNVVALCDVDEHQLAEAKKALEKTAFTPTTYVDYRDLLETQKDLDAVVIATPDHWHALITTAALRANKHVFCEKPLTHTLEEARELRELVRVKTQLVTQMGNQGSASPNMRRGIELVQAGALGRVNEVHCWVRDGAGCHAGLAQPTVGDPVPAGLHWDAWLGPAPFRVYKQDYYHTWNWRGWYDFGSGVMGDFGCHALNLPFRALKLDYPKRIEAQGVLTGLPTYSAQNRIRFQFAQRGELAPVEVHWYDEGVMPGSDILPATLVAGLGEAPTNGVLLIGENGFTFGNAWTGSDYIQLKDEKKISGILNHEATKHIAESLPRSPGHLKEWVDACTGGPATFSDFERGGHLTEIALSGVVALKLQQAMDWNGEKQRAENAPEAIKFIRSHYRTGWKI